MQNNVGNTASKLYNDQSAESATCGSHAGIMYANYPQCQCAHAVKHNIIWLHLVVPGLAHSSMARYLTGITEASCCCSSVPGGLKRLLKVWQTWASCSGLQALCPVLQLAPIAHPPVQQSHCIAKNSCHLWGLATVPTSDGRLGVTRHLQQ